MKNKNKKDIKKILHIAMIVLGSILVLEIGFLIFTKIRNEKNTTYLNSINNAIKVSNGYLTVGSSDFKYSHNNKHEKSYNKAILTKYDNDYKTKLEIKLDSEYNSDFYDVIEVVDGYIAVGRIQMNQKQNENKVYEAVMIKYDKEGKQIWRKNFQVLDDSRFIRIKENQNGELIVIGQSLYEPNVIGNHQTGGAIIAKYNKDGELITSANYDGPKSGVYNDFIEVSDGYIVVGKIKSATGIIIKYDKNLKIMWRKLYGNTDTYGLRAIAKVDNNSFVVVGSKTSAVKDSANQDAIILKYSFNGEKISEEKYKLNNINRYEEVLVDEQKIIVTGVSSNDIKSPVITIINEYDFNLNLNQEKSIKSEKSLIISSIIGNMMFGYTNSKIDKIKSNGKDVFPVCITLDNKYNISYNDLK